MKKFLTTAIFLSIFLGGCNDDNTTNNIINLGNTTDKQDNTTVKQEPTQTIDSSTSQSKTIDQNKTVIINHYTLPPMPDKALNDSTLEGIDSNNNGVRDDVEIYIIKRYKNKHPLFIEIAMQDARNTQLVLSDKRLRKDKEYAQKMVRKVNSAMDCQRYYTHGVSNNSNDQTMPEEIIYNDRIIFTNLKVVINTDQRRKAYHAYNSLLSGGVYEIPWSDESKKFCDFNTTKYKTSNIVKNVIDNDSNTTGN